MATPRIRARQRPWAATAERLYISINDNHRISYLEPREGAIEADETAESSSNRGNHFMSADDVLAQHMFTEIKPAIDVGWNDGGATSRLSDNQEGQALFGRELRTSKDNALSLSLAMAGLGVAMALLLIHFRRYFLQDDLDRKEYPTNTFKYSAQLPGPLKHLDEERRLTRAPISTRIREALRGVILARSTRSTSVNNYEKTSEMAMQMRERRRWDMRTILSKAVAPSVHPLEPPRLETIAEESPFACNDEDSCYSSSVGSKPEWHNFMPTLPYSFDPTNEAIVTTRGSDGTGSVDSSASEAARSSIQQHLEVSSEALSPTLQNIDETHDEGSTSFETGLPIRSSIGCPSSREAARIPGTANNESIKASTVEVSILRKDPTLKPFRLKTVTNSSKEISEKQQYLREATLRTATTEETLGGIGSIDLSGTEKASERSYLSWTASERRALREAEEELLFFERDWSILLQSEGSSECSHDSRRSEWAKLATQELLRVRERLENVRSSHGNGSFSDLSLNSDVSITKSLRGDVDHLLVTPNDGENWESCAIAEVQTLKRQISLLRGSSGLVSIQKL